MTAYYRWSHQARRRATGHAHRLPSDPRGCSSIRDAHLDALPAWKYLGTSSRCWCSKINLTFIVNYVLGSTGIDTKARGAAAKIDCAYHRCDLTKCIYSTCLFECVRLVCWLPPEAIQPTTLYSVQWYHGWIRQGRLILRVPSHDWVDTAAGGADERR